MKTTFLTLLVFLCLACSNKKSERSFEKDTLQKQEILVTEFQSILDSANVQGAILIYDLQKNSYYTNDFGWSQKGRLPASTFKIPNSIIALETGVIESDSVIFKWNGQKRNMSIWEQDLDLKEAFHYSCLPCYQEIANTIGVKRMNKYLNDFAYGHMVVDESTLEVFWLEGDSKISQLEEIDFLKRFYLSELSISNRTEQIMKKIMVIKENDKYKISGKTGWSIRKGNNNGWFVGYLETGTDVYFFATNISPTSTTDIKHFASLRKEVTYAALNSLQSLVQIK